LGTPFAKEEVGLSVRKIPQKPEPNRAPIICSLWITGTTVNALAPARRQGVSADLSGTGEADSLRRKRLLQITWRSRPVKGRFGAVFVPAGAAPLPSTDFLYTECTCESKRLSWLSPCTSSAFTAPLPTSPPPSTRPSLYAPHGFPWNGQGSSGIDATCRRCEIDDGLSLGRGIPFPRCRLILDEDWSGCGG
jgi:hypothetical protein